MNTSEKHAVVLGGSLAGLSAARILAGHFDRVTLIERDPYTENCGRAINSRTIFHRAEFGVVHSSETPEGLLLIQHRNDVTE